MEATIIPRSQIRSQTIPKSRIWIFEVCLNQTHFREVSTNGVGRWSWRTSVDPTWLSYIYRYSRMCDYMRGVNALTHMRMMHTRRCMLYIYVLNTHARIDAHAYEIEWLRMKKWWPFVYEREKRNRWTGDGVVFRIWKESASFTKCVYNVCMYVHINIITTKNPGFEPMTSSAGGQN